MFSNKYFTIHRYTQSPILAFALLAIILTLYICSSLAGTASKIKTVVITQIVSHDSLNKVREGIVEELKAKYGTNLNINFSNANGSIVTAAQIASKIVAEHPDLIIAIATPSAQTVISALNGASTPVLFASVTDPIGAKLVSSLEQPGKNVSGTRNMSPIQEQLQIAKQIIPNLGKIGIVYNMAEANSAYMLKKIESLAKNLNIKIISQAITRTTEVKSASESIINQVDAILLLQDNAIASSLPALLKTASSHKKPVISSYIEAVAQGALFGIACDEYYIGKQTGRMAIRILEGVSPGEMAVEDPQKIELAINKETAKALGLALSPQIISQANIVY